MLVALSLMVHLTPRPLSDCIQTETAIAQVLQLVKIIASSGVGWKGNIAV